MQSPSRQRLNDRPLPPGTIPMTTADEDATPILIVTQLADAFFDIPAAKVQISSSYSPPPYSPPPYYPPPARLIPHPPPRLHHPHSFLLSFRIIILSISIILFYPLFPYFLFFSASSPIHTLHPTFPSPNSPLIFPFHRISIQKEFEGLFTKYDKFAIFAYLKGFSRARVTFNSSKQVKF